MKPTSLALAAYLLIASSLTADEPRVVFNDNPSDGEMQIVVEGKDALVYRYEDQQDLVHFYP
jgi:hypothetical protein